MSVPFYVSRRVNTRGLPSRPIGARVSSRLLTLGSVPGLFPSALARLFEEWLVLGWFGGV
jgi:hypothetical protein